MTHKAEVYFFTKAERLKDAFDLLGVDGFKGVHVPVKLHMGEPGNQFFISPSIVKLTVDKLKETGAQPFLFDTTVAYPGPRATRGGYKRAAEKHGFGENEMGCEVIIGDKGVKVKQNGYSFEVAREIYECTHLVVVSHVKGHIGSGFGGAIKNLGMGGVTKETKAAIHVMSSPKFSAEQCDLCGDCAEACPFNALTVEPDWKRDKASCMGCGVCIAVCPTGALNYREMDLQKSLALAANACIEGKRVLYVNALVTIARSCDCDPFAGPVICPDVGYLASDEMAAIDQASLDLIHEVKPDVFRKTNKIDPSKQLRFAQELGFTADYELKRL